MLRVLLRSLPSREGSSAARVALSPAVGSSSSSCTRTRVWSALHTDSGQIDQSKSQHYRPSCCGSAVLRGRGGRG